MKIVFLTAYFYPEKYASAEIYISVLTALAKEHEVHVIAPQPSRGVSEKEYIEYRALEEWNGLVIHRFPMRREERSVLKRILRYKKCERWYKKLAKSIGRAEYIFAASTPPTLGILATKIAKKLNAKLVYSLQDLFPDSLISSGILKKAKGPIWWLGRSIEKKTYKKADCIVVISKNFHENLLKKNVPPDKLFLIPNWVDLEHVTPIAKETNRLYGEYEIDKDKFTVVYAGNIGAAQDSKLLLAVMEKLKKDAGIQFVVFGGGADYKGFIEEAQAKNLENVRLNPLLSQERISEVYSLGDVALIACKPGVGKTALPSKTLSIMACDTPIIAAFDLDSELAAMIVEADAGVCVAPNDVEALSNAILEMSKDIPKVSARQYVKDNFSKELLLKRYLSLFQ